MTERLTVSVIRDADPALTDKIADAERICFGKNAWSRAAVDAFINNGYSFLVAATDGDELLGYAITSVILGEGELTNIAVLPKARRCGIASRIMSVLIENARAVGAELLHLEVREGNIPAIALYKAFGFTPDGIRKNYYSSPRENAVLMTLKL